MKRMKKWKVAVVISLGLAACFVPALEELDEEKVRGCNAEHPCLSGFTCVEGHCQPEEGSACQRGSTASCGLETGECQPGTRTCGEEGTYGPCVGALLATPEVCNGRDDDCDGSADEELSCGDGGGGDGGDAGDPCAACAAVGRTCVDNTCASCLEGYFEEGTRCLPKRAPGEACAENVNCGSGFCADGYCCDQACQGPCERCDATPGTCSPVEDKSVGEPVCTPYLCDGVSGVCPTRCETNEDCAAGVLCVNNRCGDKLPLGAACSVAGQCASGNCVDGNCCGDASCGSPPGPCYEAAGTCSNGACGYTPKPAGAVCDDNNSGTINDTCNGSGTCAGTVPGCDDPPNPQCNNPIGAWDGSKCVYTLKTAGSTCNDGNACTLNDVCNASGTCGGVTAACIDPPSHCYQPTGTCSNGSCSYIPKAAGAACDDGDPCTIDDRCNGSGTCIVTAKSCNEPPSQCHQSTGTCSNGSCNYSFKSAGSSCDDGNACTTGDVCNGSGTCGGSPLTCNGPPPSQCHQSTGTCSDGSCSYPLKPAGSPCNDGNACTTSDMCSSSGACGGGTTVTCPDRNSQCLISTGCSPDTGCTYREKCFEGMGCNNGACCVPSAGASVMPNQCPFPVSQAGVAPGFGLGFSGTQP